MPRTCLSVILLMGLLLVVVPLAVGLPGKTTLKVAPAQFNAFVAQRFPDVAQGVRQLPVVAPSLPRNGVASR